MDEWISYFIVNSKLIEARFCLGICALLVDTMKA